MTQQQIVEKFLEKPSRMEMGAGKLSRLYKCSKEDIYESRSTARNIMKKGRSGNLPRVLILDIETAPLKAYIWGIWNQNVNDEQMLSSYSWLILTWAARWLFDQETMSDQLTGKEAIAENDKRIVSSLRDLLEEADIVIAHNGRRFDIPKVNSKFVYHGLMPVSPYQQIDTLDVIKKNFGFVSNRLDSVAKLFGMGGKMKTSFDLWKRCVEGEDEALTKMAEYNRKDVELLEDVYMKIRPWVKSHPNLGLYMEASSKVCPNCGSEHIVEHGFYYTSVARYSTFKCNDCGCFSRSRINTFPKEYRKNLLVPNAR